MEEAKTHPVKGELRKWRPESLIGNKPRFPLFLQCSFSCESLTAVSFHNQNTNSTLESNGQSVIAVHTVQAPALKTCQDFLSLAAFSLGPVGSHLP